MVVVLTFWCYYFVSGSECVGHYLLDLGEDVLAEVYLESRV